jgi:hypothetical protein
MAGLISATRFTGNIRRVCASSKFVVRMASFSETPRVARLRIYLVDLTFVDVYYNQKTGTTTFAHIYRTRRIFGADNKYGVWHWHPREDPSQHQASDREIAFEEFLREVEKSLK